MSGRMRRKISGAAVLILLVGTILSLVFEVPIREDADIKYMTTGVTDVIREGTEISYIVTLKEDIDGMKFLAATYLKKITKGKLNVRIFDEETGKKFAETNILAQKLRDNQFAFADTGHLKVKDKKIRIVITGIGFQEKENVSLWMGNSDLNADTITLVNGIREQENLIVITCYNSGIHLTWEFLLVTAVFALIFIMQWEKN